MKQIILAYCKKVLFPVLGYKVGVVKMRPHLQFVLRCVCHFSFIRILLHISIQNVVFADFFLTTKFQVCQRTYSQIWRERNICKYLRSTCLKLTCKMCSQEIVKLLNVLKTSMEFMHKISYTSYSFNFNDL